MEFFDDISKKKKSLKRPYMFARQAKHDERNYRINIERDESFDWRWNF